MYIIYRKLRKQGLHEKPGWTLLLRSERLNDTTDTASSAAYLDLHLETDGGGRLRMKFYDKRDYFSFLLWTFHFHVASLQQHLHLEYISRSWSDIPYHDFLDRGLLLTRKQLNQVFLVVKLKSLLGKFIVLTMTC
jgi:hypothetical protein